MITAVGNRCSMIVSSCCLHMSLGILIHIIQGCCMTQYVCNLAPSHPCTHCMPLNVCAYTQLFQRCHRCGAWWLFFVSLLNRHAGFAQGKGAPRGALVTYIHTWRSFARLHPGVDFLLSTFESWRRSVGHFPGRKFDLVAVTTELVAEKLQQHATIGHLCQVQKLSSANLGEAAHGETMKIQPHSQCWLLTHTSAQVREWDGFPLVHDILHVASDTFKQFAHGMRYDNIVVVRSVCAVCLQELHIGNA